ncbi:MAG: methyltransferase domain-containing protein [Clostridia bacterium]
MIKLDCAQVKNILGQPNGSEKLMQNAPAAFDAAWALFCENDSAAAAFLCRCAKKQDFKQSMNALLGDERAALHTALTSDEPKMRKNAARLAGELHDMRDVHPLIAALNAEQTRFVRPSMLLALGALGGEDARGVILAYEVPAAANEGEAKHEKEEREAFASARKSFFELDKHTFTGLDKPYELMLRTPDKLADSLAYELGLMHIVPQKIAQDCVELQSQEAIGLMGARSFTELLFVLARDIAPTPKAIAIRVKQQLQELLLGAHDGKPPFGYRIELRSEMDRGAFARELASLLDGDILINSPSNYEVELRLEQLRNGGMNVFAKLFTIPDARFDYRAGALPASMHPATAAAVLRYARDYLSPDARVLDPCCGSGTFLIERGKLTDCASLTGVDIVHKAIDIARENAQLAGSCAKFIVNDCLRFEANRQYDEVIANLPFGNRVGTHAANERLYAGLLDRLPLWVKKGGTALLYTMEFTLLKKLVRERPQLKLMTEARTGAGGLMPGIFILKIQ